MATVYSLVCFGGLSGKTVTFTDSGDVVNLTNHGLRQGVTGIVFSTTGSLPTGITAGATYYPRNGADANKFTIYHTKADALAGTNKIAFTGTGTGTHTVKSALMLGLTTEQKARYGTAGSERIYNGLAAWIAGMNTLLAATPDPNTGQVCEFGEDYFDILNSNAIQPVCGPIELTTKINGVRGLGWHGGDPDKGYIILVTATSGTAIQPNAYYIAIDGLGFKLQANGAAGFTNGALSCFVEVKNCIIQGNPTATGQKGCNIDGAGSFHHNIIFNIGGDGLTIAEYGGKGLTIYNNLVTKCTGIGINQGTNTQGSTYNNISVGNGTNWGAWPSYVPAPRHASNFGEPSDKKTIAINYTVNANNITLASHGRNSAMPITFTTSGTLPTVVATGQPLVAGKVYYVRTVVSTSVFTISATPDGTVLAFSNNGSGTHYTTAIWSNDATEKYLDISTPNDVFQSWTAAPYNFRPAGSGGVPNAAASHVNNGMVVYNGVAEDMLGNVVPNYQPSVFPNELWDAGPFEFDHGNGLVPIAATLTISANTSLSGAEVRIYDADNTPAGTLGTELSGTESNPSSTYIYSAASLLNNTIYIQVMQSGYEEFLTSHTVLNVNETLTLTLKADVNA